MLSKRCHGRVRAGSGKGYRSGWRQTSTSWPRLRKLDRIGLSVLVPGQERLERHCGRGGVRARCSSMAGLHAVPRSPGGDHLIVPLRIHLAGNDSSVAPLVFHASRFAGSRLDDLAAHRGIVGRLSGGKAPWNRC
jgi:hypothetical protein